jgi:hypothetical protein
VPWDRRKQASATARGYGYDHTKARRALAAKHQPTDPCVRCGRPLGPMGRWLHLDHNRTRTGYLGFSHSTCNRTAGAREGRARQDEAVTTVQW